MSFQHVVHTQSLRYEPACVAFYSISPSHMQDCYLILRAVVVGQVIDILQQQGERRSRQ